MTGKIRVHVVIQIPFTLHFPSTMTLDYAPLYKSHKATEPKIA